MIKTFCRDVENPYLQADPPDRYVALIEQLFGDAGFPQVARETGRTIVERYWQNKRLVAIGFAKHPGEIIYKIILGRMGAA